MNEESSTYPRVGSSSVKFVNSAEIPCQQGMGSKVAYCNDTLFHVRSPKRRVPFFPFPWSRLLG